MQEKDNIAESSNLQDSTQDSNQNVDFAELDSIQKCDSNIEETNNKDCENGKCDNSNGDSSDDSSDEKNAESSKIKELEEKYIRAYAEFENIKKRLEREKYQALEYANEQILKDFLPILDTLESALESTKNDDSEAVSKIKQGIELTIDNFLKAFNKHSVELISTNGEFDPNVHNAIMQVKCEDKKDGEIAQVIQKGYKYKDRVIRPSMVAITKN